MLFDFQLYYKLAYQIIIIVSLFKMQGLEFLSKINYAKKNTKNRQAIEENLQSIAKYLEDEDILSLKLTCRPFYYYFVTAELWIGLKLNVAEQKLQYFDDFDFEEAETKLITKKDKNIRIHSLKKQTQTRNKAMVKRQPSNIKQKGKIMNENSELLFRNTQIGFKRLLKTNSKKRVSDVDYQVKQASELPKIADIQEYIIKINDPWSTNMSKAQKLVQLFKRINQFHHKFLTQLKMPSKQIGSFISKLKRGEQKVKIYCQIVMNQPYTSIINSIEGAKQNLLIDQQLNKVCRLFWNYHTPMCKISSQLPIFKDTLEKQKTRISQVTGNQNKYSVQFVQSLSAIDESVEVCLNLCQTNRQLGEIVSGQLIGVFFGIIEQMEQFSIIFQDTGQETKIQYISWNTLAKKPFFSETAFQILSSIASKLVKLSSSMCPDDLTLSIIVNKLKGIKSVAQSLLNVAKYFGKIRKQIQQKQKKGKDNKTSDSIKQFLSMYENKQDEFLYLTKQPGKLQKIISQFKQKIANLKNKIQTN